MGKGLSPPETPHQAKTLTRKISRAPPPGQPAIIRAASRRRPVHSRVTSRLLAAVAVARAADQPATKDAKQVMSKSGLLEAFMESRPALLRYLVLRGARADEADDILQEVYIKLFQDPVGPVSQPRAYLYRVVTNHFLLHRRTTERRGRREKAWVDVHSGEPREVDEEPSAETRLIAQQQVMILQSVLDTLPERTRTIFRRFRIEGEAQRQIAADLGISVSAVEKHLARSYEAISAAKLRLDEGTEVPRHLKVGRRTHGF